MWKSLAAGTLGPRAQLTIQFGSALNLAVDYPAVITASGRGSVTIIETRSDRITLRSNIDRAAPYWLVVIPRSLIIATTTDWRKVLQQLKERLLRGKEP